MKKKIIICIVTVLFLPCVVVLAKNSGIISSTHNKNSVQEYSKELQVNIAAGKFDEALKYANMIIEAEPEWYQMYNNRGLIHRNLGHYDLAIADFEKALEIQPDYTTAKANLANAKMLAGDIKAATKTLESNTGKKDFNYYNSLGASYMQQRDFKKAIECLDNSVKEIQKMKEVDPKAYAVYMNRGFSKLQLEDYKGAISDFDVYLKYFENNGVGLYYRGIAYGSIGNMQQFKEDLQAAKKYIDRKQYPREYENAVKYLSQYK